MQSIQTAFVPPEGPRKARIMLIGQNPGAEEAKQGRPFAGRSGRYLNSVLAKYGIERSRLYITAVVKERTPGNRMPTREEIERWLPVLLAEIRDIKPEVILLMGKLAQSIPRSIRITYIESPHPAAAMRFPKQRILFEAATRKLKRLYDYYDKA
jgi:uracil-DNA glycosylase family 4